MKDIKTQIVDLMPYGSGFHFVDELLELDEDHIVGTYTYKEDELFYADHFPGHPITPGVILTETMAQIGLVALGMYLIQAPSLPEPPRFLFVSSEVNFRSVVYPGETVRVVAEKQYFRMKKLKVKATLYNGTGEVACKGTLSGLVFL